MIWIAAIATCFTVISGRSLVQQEKTKDPDGLAARYLHKYGYSQNGNKESGALFSLDSAIKDFQLMAGLSPTGQMDASTIAMMETPRCGVKDGGGGEDNPLDRGAPGDLNARHKRFALQGSRWRVKELTYKVTKYPDTRLTKTEVDRTMRQAFDVWERVTDLKFEKKTAGKVHIEIRFERRNHGDDDAFDGEGGTLAHAFFPVFGGDAHFDEEEDWTVDTPRGTSLLMSAAHELGHSLGLSHSNDRSALMAPFYRGYERNVSLSKDDIEGIEALYGEKDSTSREKSTTPGIGLRGGFKPSTTTEAPINNRELCDKAKIDTMVTLQNDTTFAFKGNKYWKLTDTSIEPGYPRSITADWDGLPGDLDAAFTWNNGRSYFFKGSEYWRFTNGRMDKGYPKALSAGFSGIPRDVDAAFVWPANGKIYFFKGSQYWKFDPEADPPVPSSYPRPVANWDGIPNNIDAAVQYTNGKVYFFKKGQYYRWDDDNFSVDDANPSFPRDTGFWWFGCKQNSSPLTRFDK